MFFNFVHHVQSLGGAIMFYDVYVNLCRNVGKKPSVVAAELGINKSNVSNWKNNGYTPRGEALQKIADYFRVTTDYLLTGEEKEKAADPKADGDDESPEDIIPGYDSLSDLNKNRVRDYVAVLLAAQQNQ